MHVHRQSPISNHLAGIAVHRRVSVTHPRCDNFPFSEKINLTASNMWKFIFPPAATEELFHLRIANLTRQWRRDESARFWATKIPSINGARFELELLRVCGLETTALLAGRAEAHRSTYWQHEINKTNGTLNVCVDVRVNYGQLALSVCRSVCQLLLRAFVYNSNI